MTWTKVAAAMVVAGVVGGAGSAHASPLSAGRLVNEVVAAPVETVQYYYYEDEYDVPPPPRYRVYREPPPYRYYDRPPPRYYGPPPRAVIESRKEAIKDYRKARKEIFKEKTRAWNRAHGF